MLVPYARRAFLATAGAAGVAALAGCTGADEPPTEQPDDGGDGGVGFRVRTEAMRVDAGENSITRRVTCAGSRGVHPRRPGVGCP